MKTMCAFIVVVTLFTSGCGFAERHPTQAKVYALVGGAAAGVGIGLATRGRGTCSGVYEGQPYTGNPCPHLDRPESGTTKLTGGR
jgi:hypothetical protein